MTRILSISASVLVFAACTPGLEGAWTGQCITPQAETRVRLNVYEEPVDEPVLLVSASVHLAARPAEVLYLDCAPPQVRERDVTIEDCTGFWSPSAEESGPNSFAVQGELRKGDPTATLAGSCVFEDTEGDLALVRTP